MTINWPTTPTLDQEITGPRGEIWKWDGQKWVSLGAGGGATSGDVRFSGGALQYFDGTNWASVPSTIPVPLPVSQGGTGATTVAGARNSLVLMNAIFSFSIAGKPPAGQVYNIRNRLALTVSEISVVCTTLSSSTATFQLNKFSSSGSGLPTVTSIGSISVPAGWSSDTQSIGPVNISYGDSIQLVAPIPQDATMADIAVTVMTTRV